MSATPTDPSFGGVGGGTNPAGERELTVEQRRHDWGGMIFSPVVRIGVSNEDWSSFLDMVLQVEDEHSAALRAVVEGLRTQLREAERRAEEWAAHNFDLLAQVAAVKALHEPLRVATDLCQECGGKWPCDTRRALEPK